jgi:hypothetical protein
MITYSKMRFFPPVLLLICCIAVGCGEVRAPVTGKVTYPDGSPLTVGDIRGYGNGSHIRGKIGADGSFELYEVQPGDRVPAGKTYAISIVNTQIPEEIAGVASVPGAPVKMPKIITHVDPKFERSETSELVLELPKSAKPVEFNVEVTKP